MDKPYLAWFKKSPINSRKEGNRKFKKGSKNVSQCHLILVSSYWLYLDRNPNSNLVLEIDLAVLKELQPDTLQIDQRELNPFKKTHTSHLRSPNLNKD